MTFGSWTFDSEPDRNALCGLLLDVVELRRFDVNEKSSAPHSRLSYVHLILLRCGGWNESIFQSIRA